MTVTLPKRPRPEYDEVGARRLVHAECATCRARGTWDPASKLVTWRGVGGNEDLVEVWTKDFCPTLCMSCSDKKCPHCNGTGIRQ